MSYKSTALLLSLIQVFLLYRGDFREKPIGCNNPYDKKKFSTYYVIGNCVTL